MEDRVIVKNKELYNKKGFGKPYLEIGEDYISLDLIEAFYLFEKNKIKIKNFDKKKFFEYCKNRISNFPTLYLVYKDLREKGYVVKTGFKFGTHFRVYEKGVLPKKGPKEFFEHTKFIVHVVREEEVFSLPEMARAVRLATNIRAKMIWAVVDRENNITYYEITRLKLWIAKALEN